MPGTTQTFSSCNSFVQNSSDESFDGAIDKICEEQNISVIFETNKGKVKK